MMKEWQRGIELEVLKEHCAVFEDHDAGLSFSQFGSPNEAQVADWISRGWVSTVRQGGRLASVLVAQTVAEREVTFTDFRGAIIGTARRGDLVVRRVAGDLEPVRGSLPRANGHSVYVQIWQEHAADRALVDALKARWLGTQIRASSEMRGLWKVPATGYGTVPWHERHSIAALAGRFNVGPLRSALERRRLEFANHYSSYNSKDTWSALALRGYGGDPTFIIKPSEMSKKWKDANPDKLTWPLLDTPLRAALPEAESLINALPGVKHRVRLMRLAPGGGELKRHADITDPDAGVVPGKLLRIHIPIVTNPRVLFESWDLMGARRKVHMAEGRAWYLDTRKPHTARNDGNSERIHLVIDLESSADLLARLPQG